MPRIEIFVRSKAYKKNVNFDGKYDDMRLFSKRDNTLNMDSCTSSMTGKNGKNTVCFFISFPDRNDHKGLSFDSFGKSLSGMTVIKLYI